MKGLEQSAPRGRELIAAYQRLETRASRMVMLARQRDWGTLIEEEQEYVMAVTALTDLEQGVELDERQRRAKGDMLERILQHDLEVRSRLLERREELTRLMAVSRRERDLNRSYGAAALVDSRYRFEKERP